jgi:hypothetical protein
LNVDFAFVCDYADVTGKINAFGIGFDTIYSPTIPCKHNLFFLVMQIRASSLEIGEKEVEVNLIDDDGKSVIPPLKGKINLVKPPSGTETISRLALQFQNVEFPRYGTYSLHTLVEGHEMVRVPIKISQPPTQPVN